VILWRISNHMALPGDGPLRASGRWHTRGHRVVYCAKSPAAALLEILVHYEMEVRDLPTLYRLLKITAPGDLVIEHTSLGELPKRLGGENRPHTHIGDAWLTRRSAALLHVPSAVVPETVNVLVNPAYPDATRLSITKVSDHVIDPRLLT
jgi:RES domain-containing protein